MRSARCRGHGGQIVASDSTRSAFGTAASGPRFRDLGLYRLKGLSLDVRLYQVDGDDASWDFPPLRASPAAELGFGAPRA